MKIIIIGAGGFIGSALVRHLSSAGYDIACADVRDLQGDDYPFFKVDGSAEDWKDLFASEKYGFCINAAGSANVNDSLVNPETDFSLNVKDTSAVLEGIRLGAKSTCAYIHISSAAVYGNPARLPVSEKDPCSPVSPYGWNKLMAEELCREYHTLYGLPVAIARPFSVYGPGLMKQLFWDIFNKWKRNSGEIELWGTGDESRDFIHIHDLSRCFDLLIRKAPMKAEAYNLANGRVVTIRAAASLFLSHFGGSSALRFNGRRHEGNPLNWQADITAMESLGFAPEVRFENGIEEMAQWMLDLK